MQLAQLNIARMLKPLDSPSMQDFVDNLGPINALAENSPGFVWRLVGEGNDATSLRPFDDDEIIVNMSVWESLESLREYVFKTAHAEFLKRRAEWFLRVKEPMVVLWWVQAGHVPSLQEAKEKLEALRALGPSQVAFTFAQPFDAPV